MVKKKLQAVLSVTTGSLATKMHVGNTRRIYLCNNCLKKGTFTMWAEHIVLLTRGSSGYPLAPLNCKAYTALEQVTEDTIQKEEHTTMRRECT